MIVTILAAIGGGVVVCAISLLVILALDAAYMLLLAQRVEDEDAANR